MGKSTAAAPTPGASFNVCCPASGRELLRLIAEQQAALGKLQQLVVGYVLSESQPGLSTVNTAPRWRQVTWAPRETLSRGQRESAAI
jgi:hypothetical protein